MRSDAVCKSCGAKIRWAISATTGKSMPLDTEANANGNLGIVEWRGGPPSLPTPVFAINPTKTLTPYRYLSHFVGCAQASEHRRDRTAGSAT